MLLDHLKANLTLTLSLTCFLGIYSHINFVIDIVIDSKILMRCVLTMTEGWSLGQIVMISVQFDIDRRTPAYAGIVL